MPRTRCPLPPCKSGRATCCWSHDVSTKQRRVRRNFLEVEAKNVEAQILLANALAGLKNLDGAVAELEQAIESNPGRGATYSSLGAMELERGERSASEKAFKRAVELSPATAAPHLALGGFYWATSQWPDAEQKLIQALTIEPDNSLAHRAAATFFVFTNRADRAEEHLAEWSRSPRRRYPKITLADYYVARNQVEAARRILEPMALDAKSAAAANTRLAALDRAAGHSGSQSAPGKRPAIRSDTARRTVDQERLAGGRRQRR